MTATNGNGLLKKRVATPEWRKYIYTAIFGLIGPGVIGGIVLYGTVAAQEVKIGNNKTEIARVEKDADEAHKELSERVDKLEDVVRTIKNNSNTLNEILREVRKGRKGRP